jgi:RNA polymerase sigma factor (sigma-70 family)
MSTPREFLTTRWSIVLAAQDGSSRDAMERLCGNYWFPLYAYVRRAGHSSEDAQDLTQEFFARLLAKSWLDDVQQERGRFRSWLLAAMRHFLTNEWHRSRTQKRGGDAVVFALDSEEAERRYHDEPSPDAPPDELYDRRWALTLIDTVLGRLGGEFAAAGKASLFAELRGAITGGARPYAEIGATLGMSEGAVKIAVVRLRERFRELLRAEIAETVATPGETDAEMRHLLDALAGG